MKQQNDKINKPLTITPLYLALVLTVRFPGGQEYGRTKVKSLERPIPDIYERSLACSFYLVIFLRTEDNFRPEVHL